MKTANELALELQAKFDYFFAAVILASLGFLIQTNIVDSKETFTLYVISLTFFGVSAILCFYRLQQKPHIYQLHSKDESLNINENDPTKLQLKTVIKIYERKYEISYSLMLFTFVVGALSFAIAKIVVLFSQVF